MEMMVVIMMMMLLMVTLLSDGSGDNDNPSHTSIYIVLHASPKMAGICNRERLQSSQNDTKKKQENVFKARLKQYLIEKQYLIVVCRYSFL